MASSLPVGSFSYAVYSRIKKKMLDSFNRAERGECAASVILRDDSVRNYNSLLHRAMVEVLSKEV